LQVFQNPAQCGFELIQLFGCDTVQAFLLQLLEHPVGKLMLFTTKVCEKDALDPAVAFLRAAFDITALLHIIQDTADGGCLYVAVFRKVTLDAAIIIAEVTQNGRLPPGDAILFHHFLGGAPVYVAQMYYGHHDIMVMLYQTNPSKEFKILECILLDV